MTDGVSELISDFGVNVWVEIVAQLYVQLYESYLPRASHDVTYYDWLLRFYCFERAATSRSGKGRVKGVDQPF